MGKQEPDSRVCGQAQFGHHRLEIMTAGAQPMQPDHGSGGVRVGFQLDILQFRHKHTSIVGLVIGAGLVGLQRCDHRVGVHVQQIRPDGGLAMLKPALHLRLRGLELRR